MRNSLTFIALIFLTGCASSTTSNKKPSKLLSVRELETGSPIKLEELKAGLTRSFKSGGVFSTPDFSINVLLLTEDYLLKDAQKRGITVDRNYKNMIQKQTKESTCFSINGYKKTYGYGYSIRGPSFNHELWDGVLVSDGGATVQKVHVGNLSMMACSARAIDIKKPFKLFLKTEFADYGVDRVKKYKHAELTWSTAENEDFVWTPEEPWKKQAYRETSNRMKVLKKLVQTTPRNMNTYILSAQNEKASVIFKAIQTRNLKYFKKYLPLDRAQYSPSDIENLTMLGYSMATANGKECNLEMFEHLNKIGLFPMSDFIKSRSNFDESFSDESKALKCGPVARNLYGSADTKLKSILALPINNALADTVSSFAFDKSLLKNILIQFKTAKNIHREVSKKCVNGSDEDCILAETLEKNISQVGQILKWRPKRKVKELKSLKSDYQKYLEQLFKRKKMDKKYFI